MAHKHIKGFYPNFFSDKLIAYVCLRIIRYFNANKSLTANVLGLSSDETVTQYKKREFKTNYPEAAKKDICCIYYDTIPSGFIWKIVHHILSRERIKKIAEYKYLKGLNNDDIAYLWPGVSLQLYKRIKALGHIIVSERVNSLRLNSKEILDKEFLYLKLPITHGITAASVDSEIRRMELSDYIFSPSPCVTKSILDAGIPGSKIIATSYGLKKSEILSNTCRRGGDKKITAIFVGTICVRKGIHLLLKAWVNSKVNGVLKVIGSISFEIKDIFDDYLNNNCGIEHIDFVDDLRPIYKEADFFILPSLEEGSPLVTYLALGASLPVIVSPMGAGGVIENNQEGFIVDPHNEKALIEAIEKLSNDPALRKKMSIKSGVTALKYTWDKVSAQRSEDLLKKINY